jgi:hypothetical protein
MSTLRAVATLILACVVMLFLADTSAMANGGRAKRIRYAAEVRTGDAAETVCRFAAEMEPLLFRLATLGDRYGVMRIAIRNAGDRKLVLSLTADRVELLLPGGPRPAILDLRARDPQLWDSLPAELRAAVAYPRSVEAREEESVFVFVPIAETAVAPQALRYTIASLPAGPVILRDMTPVMKR